MGCGVGPQTAAIKIRSRKSLVNEALIDFFCVYAPSARVMLQ